jgi:tRNA modification GTPase
VRELRDEGTVVDRPLVLLFEAGSSFTGEDAAELHLHGSPAVVARVLAILSARPGLRQAEPGEFTRRALENGRMDLTQVEGLADLIEAETEAQRRQAMRVLEGDLCRAAEEWRGHLVQAQALVAASIDFADEDLPEALLANALSHLNSVAVALRSQEAGAFAAERVRDGFEVAILGRPNLGKSTLINKIAGRLAAITSEEPGTTRDIIEVRMDLDGLAVTFLDTAGIRETTSAIEAVGVSLALSRAESADLRVVLVETDEPPPVDLRPGDIVVRSKADLRRDTSFQAVSGRTGEGVEALLRQISAELQSRVAGASLATRERHRAAISAARVEAEAAQEILRQRPEHPELSAEHMRRAARALDSLIGRVDVEDLLDEIFARFCIGK